MSELCTCGHPRHDGHRCGGRVTSVPGYILSCRCYGDTYPMIGRMPVEVTLPNDMKRPTVDMPDDVRRILTRIAMHAHENPTSAERRTIGEWLGIARHMLPRTGT